MNITKLLRWQVHRTIVGNEIGIEVNEHYERSKRLEHFQEMESLSK